MAKISKITAREILASGGSPSLEVSVELDTGTIGEASISYGASAGSKEATVLLDNDPRRYFGKGMQQAITNISDKIAPMLIGIDAVDQRLIDEKMIELDGTEKKSNLGGNTILAISMAVARAKANDEKLPLYQYLKKCFGLNDEITKLPKPMVVMIEGGKHADKSTDLQEYCLSAIGNRSAKENVRMMMEIYESLRKILKEQGLSTNVGNEGAFAPSGLSTNEEPLNYLTKAIREAGYTPGADIGFSIDAAASEFANTNSELQITNYELRIENKKLTTDELIEYYGLWIDKYPFVSWEDMLDENDWDGWKKMVERIGGKFPLIADDLTVTNTKLWQKSIDTKAATAILVKLNQAGTLTETIDCCLLANKNGLWTIPSHRGGGETNDTFMVDLAVAVGSEYIKVGPTRGERVCKYNRLMRIEEELR